MSPEPDPNPDYQVRSQWHHRAERAEFDAFAVAACVERMQARGEETQSMSGTQPRIVVLFSRALRKRDSGQAARVGAGARLPFLTQQQPNFLPFFRRSEPMAQTTS